MTLDSESETLPPLYESWVNDLLGAPIPRESRATCSSCAMRAEPGATAETKRHYFDSVIKCCTYLPTLYNFLVGGALSDQDPSSAPGRASVEKRISGGLGVTPLGLMQTPTYAVHYQQSKQSFGKARSLKCPHYIEDGGRCGVWRHRESTCATWFCKHVSGSAGYAFWRDGLHNLLQIVEIGLARWCLLELGVSDELLSNAVGSRSWKGDAAQLTGDALDERVDPEIYAKTWGEWRGREHTFYIRCAELVDALSWAEVLQICGPEARAYAQLTVKAYKTMVTRDLPAKLQVGTFELLQMLPGTMRLKTYSEYDPIDVPKAVVDVLPYFDGRPTTEVLAAIAEEHGIEVETALIQKMLHFDLLVPVK